MQGKKNKKINSTNKGNKDKTDFLDKIHFSIANDAAKEVELETQNGLHQKTHLEKPWYYRKLSSAFSIFMAIVFIAWIFAGFPIGGIIRGQLESTPLENNNLQLEEFTIEFEESTLRELLDLYYQNQVYEFSVCLQGDFQENLFFKDKYLITSLYLPTTYEQSFSHVKFESCSEDTLIMLHTHPYKSCLASSQDLETLANNREKNPNLVMLVMCEPQRFSVY